MKITLSKETNKNGEVVSVKVTIERDSAYERRRFGTEEEARNFIKRLKESEGSGAGGSP
ncbi:MAG: hypothetical protein ACLFPD_07795 [Desulfosudaceae bacterium]